MKKNIIALLFMFVSYCGIAQQISTGSFSGVAYTKISGGYSFVKHGSAGPKANETGVTPDGRIFSPNRQYFIVYQGNGILTEAGKLVLYKSANNQVLWRSGMGFKACIMQTDGNLVVYTNPSKSNKSGAVWASNTYRNDDAFLAIQDDGNVVIYNSNNTRALWATGTNGR